MSQLTRRLVLQSAAASVATLALAPLVAAADKKVDKKADKKGYTLPKLPYDYDALKVSIDEETMRIHHDKHHQAYINNANKLLADHPKLLEMPPEDLLRDIKKVPAEKRQGAINNVGGHSNHSLFWGVMGPKGGGEPGGKLGKDIENTFGTFDAFQKALNQKAVSQFGSGWAWLVHTKKGLEVIGRPNQDSPYMDGLTPLLGIDAWEHAYYLRYKNVRLDYVAAWWKVVNWDTVAERHASAMKG